MSSIKVSVKKSSRILAIGLLITFISGIALASRWESVSVFAQNFGFDTQAKSTSVGDNPLLTGNLFKNDDLLIPGTCDTAGPIEVEGSVGGTTPTAYATLGAAFTAINAGTHTGAITIDVCGSTTEAAASSTLNASGSGAASYTSITMAPAGGAARTITAATTAGSPMIDLNGADNVTINGLNTGGNSLTISNTTASATSGTSTIRFIGGATNNTITNSTILGSGSASVATNGATIFFSTDVVTTAGNDTNTISNNNIGSAGANLSTKGILCNGSTGTQAIGNSGLLIDNNNIFDYFGAAVTSAGVAVNGGCNTFSITNNRFYQTATRTWTTGAEHNGILMNSATGVGAVQGMTITGNIIGYASNTQTGTYALTGSTGIFRGIRFNGVTPGTTSNINNNTIANVSLTGVTSSGTSTSSPFAAMLFNEGNIVSNGNTIGSQSATGSLTFSTTTTSATDVYGIFNFSSNAWTTNTNNIGGLSVTNLGASGTFLVYGMRANTGAVAWNAASNNIGGNVANSIQLTGTGTSSQVVGMQTPNAISTFTSNTIQNLTTNIGTGTTSGASVIGIVITATQNHTLSQNTITNLSNTNATAASVVTGIQFTGSTANVVERNYIAGLSAATNSATAEVNGIRVGGGTTVYRNNMITFGAGIPNALGAVATNSSTAAVNGINEALGTDQFFHNSVYIGGAPSAGTGASFAFNSTQTTNTRSFRNNIFFNGRSNAGATGKNYAVKINGTTPNPTGLTINNNDYFVNGSGGVFGFYNSADVANLAGWQTAVGQDANSISADPLFVNNISDLHLTAASPARDIAANVGVANDFDGESRPGANALFDIGADEFDGIAPVANDIQATAFIDPTNGGSKLAGAAFSPQASFTNNGTAAQTNVTVRYRICTDNTCTTVLYNQTATIASIAPGATVTVTFPSTSIATGGTYTIKARAELVGDTVPANDEITGTLNIQTPLSGNYTVGAGGNYPTLTAAISALNNLGVSGPTTLTLTDASYTTPAETFPLTINAIPGASATNTVTIKPNTGVSPMITGSSASCLLNLNGADFVTIDGSNTVGGTSRDMTFTNTNTGTSSAVVCFTSLGVGAGATNDTVKNTNLTGTTVTATNGTLFGVFSGSSTISTTSAGADNDNNTVQNNSVTKTQTGIYSGGASAANKNTVTIITQNVMNAASPNNLNQGGILVNFEDGVKITRNDISVLRNDGTTGQTGTAFGIALGVIPNNSVTTFTGSDVTNAEVSRNRISGVTQLNSTGYSGFGIVVNSVTSGTTLVANNMVSGVRTASTASDFSAGIVAGGGTGSTTQIYFNSVSMTGTRGAASFPSYGLAINSGDPIIDIKNNIFYNTQTSTGTAKMYAIGTGSTTFANMSSSYNDLFVVGANAFVGQTGGLGTTGTDRLTLAAWNAATGQDAPPMSKSVNPTFVDDLTNLHLQPTSTLINMGITIATVTDDFDGQTRDAMPDIGADEIIAAAPAGTLAFSSATYTVGEGGGTVTLTVNRTGGSNGAVTADYTLGGGTATGGAACGGAVDYVNTGGTVSFANGETTKTFTVAICDDALFEGDETFNATLSNATGGATVGTPNPATVTITDNDAAATPLINVNPTSLMFGNQIVNTTSSQMSVTITNNGTANLTIGTVTLTGANPGDYTIINSPSGATIAPGNNVMFQVTFTPSATGLRTATITIPNNDSTNPNPTVSLTGTGVQPGTIQFSSTTYSVSETGPTATITATRTGGTDGTVGVSYSTVAGGTATGGAACGAGIDYVNTSGTLSWTNGDSANKSFTVTICDDSLFESPDETVNLALTNPTGGATLGTPNAATLTINENDTAPSLQFNSPTYSNSDDIAQNIGKSDELAPQVATITVTRTGATENAVSVNYATVAGGTAIGGAACAANSGVDYVTTNGTLNFASGDLVKTFNITVCSDALFEGNETVNLALSNPTPPAVLGTPNTAVLTIVDNETIPTLQFSSPTYSNSDDIAAHGITTDEFAPSVATITVTRTGATENAVSVDYATMGGTATGGASCTTGVDYIITSGTLNFGSGVNSQTFNVTVCTDGLFEGNETVNLVLSNPQPTGQATLGTPNTAVLTIVDNDAQPSVQFSSATYSVGEAGPTATITVTRTGAPDNAVSVNYASSNGTATGGAACGGAVDYQNTSGTLNFAAGVLSQSFTVPICDDGLAEMSETVNLALSNPTGAVLGSPNTAVLTITDNDSAPTLQFSAATVSVSEGAGTATLTVTRNGATGNAVSVDYSTLGGSATGGASCAAGVDFINASGTLNFASGDVSKMFTVTICEDALIEGNETFTASLSNAMGGATIGIPSTETVTITDNDFDTTPPTITYTPLPNTNSTMNPVLSVTGMDNVGITTMTIFWSVNGGAYNSNACSLSGGTPQNGTWSCVINGTLTNPSSIAYYVTAQDAAANSTSNPSAGAAAPNLYTIGAATVPAGTYTNASLSYGTMLGGNVTVTNNLTLGGLIYTGANTLTLDCMATVSGAGPNNYIIGTVQKIYCGTGMFTYPVGTNPDGMLQQSNDLGFASEYSPFVANVTAGTFPSSLTVTVTDGNLAGADPAKSASRYWDVTETGNLTADISYTYLNQDVNGDESTYQVLRREAGTTAIYTPGSVNAATNTATALGVTNFSSWGAGNLVALAANASITGRVLTSAGQGIRNVKVTISGGNLPEPQIVSTGSFGYYHFDDLEVGQTYIITVNSQRYVFSNPTSVLTLQEDISEYNFTAQPF